MKGKPKKKAVKKKEKINYNPISGEHACDVIKKLFEGLDEHYKKFGSLSVGALSVQIASHLIDKLHQNGHHIELNLIAKYLVAICEGEL